MAAAADDYLILVGASQAGGMYRLPSGTAQLRTLGGEPAHPTVSYVSGGAAIAAQSWDQCDEPDLRPLASISTDGGTTSTSVPIPAA